MWVDYRGSLSTVYNDGENFTQRIIPLSTCAHRASLVEVEASRGSSDTMLISFQSGHINVEQVSYAHHINNRTNNITTPPPQHHNITTSQHHNNITTTSQQYRNTTTSQHHNNITTTSQQYQNNNTYIYTQINEYNTHTTYVCIRMHACIKIHTFIMLNMPIQDCTW